jgi:branched-chain amino acid transport system permease protein
MTTVYSGLSVGALYAIAGVVFTLPLVRCGIINFAQTFYIVLGNYLTLDLLQKGWNSLAIFVALFTLGGVLGGLQEVLTVRPTKWRHETALVTTVGMGIAVEGFVIAYWGPTPSNVSFFGGNDPFTLFGGRLVPDDLALMALAVLMGIGFQLAVTKTRWGMLGRATMTDAVAARLRGVRVLRLRTMAFVLASAISCGLGPLTAPKMGASIDSALHLVVFAFAAAAIGGFGSFGGTVFGGFAVGLVEAFAARYLGVDWTTIVIFAALAGTLVFRPTGLFGSRQLRVI